MNRFYFFLLLFVNLGYLNAQDLLVEDSVCINTSFSPILPVEFGEDVDWDFCEGRFLQAPQTILLQTRVLTYAREIRVIEDQGSYYAIILSNNSSIVALRFNSSLAGISQLSNLGNPGGFLVAPWGLELVKEGSQWIAFVGNYNGTGQIVRLKFTQGLLQVPEADTLSGIALPTLRNTGIALLPDFNNSKQLLVSSTTGAFYTIDFGDSYLNNPSVENVITSPGVVNSFGLRVTKVENEYFGILTSIEGTFYQLRFTESGNVLSESISGVYPKRISIVKPNIILDKGKLNIVSPFYATKNWLSLELNPNTFIAEKLYTFENLAISNAQSASDIIKINGRYLGFSLDENSGALYRYEFSAPCYASISSSTLPSPTFTTTGGGKLYFSVTNKETGRNVADSMFVRKPLEANFSSTFNCFGTTTEFTNLTNEPGTRISSITWNFGDPASGAANTSTNLSPNHDFTSPGLYTVSYTIIDECGFSNQVQKQTRIFPENDSSPNFEIEQSTICSFDSLQFLDQSTYLNDEIIAWQWDFGDGNSSSLRHPRHAFVFDGNYNIQLSITLSSGCVRSISKNKTIISGTRIRFSVYKNCENAPTEFTDATVMSQGDIEISRTWNFGDPASGAQNISNLKNPVHTFSAMGTYLVVLQVENSQGCSNSFTQSVIVYENPDIRIENPTALSNRPFRFRTDEIVTESIITDYLWNFGQNEAASTLTEPFYTYDATGEFEASLFVKTQAGCEANKPFDVLVLEGIATENFPHLQYQATDTIDANETISIEDNSTNYTQLSWDFNEGDLRLIPTLQEVLLNSTVPFRSIYDYKLIKEESIWYMLAVTNDSRFRVFKFTNGLDSSPEVFDYGNPSSLLQNAWGIDVIKENGKWRGLITNFGGGYGLVYFSFEQGLTSSPIVSKVAYTFNNGNLANVAIRKFQGDLYAFVLGYQSRLEILNFGGKLFDGLQPGAIQRSIPIVNQGFSFDVIVKDNQIFGAYILTDGRQFQFKIGADFSYQSIDVNNRINSLKSFGSGTVAFDAGEIVYIYSDYNTGRLHRVNIPEDMTPAKVKYSLLKDNTGIVSWASLRLVKDGTNWIGFGLNYSQGSLFKLNFSEAANIIPITSTEPVTSVQFNTPGTFYFTLKAIDHLGHTSYLTDSVRVRRPPIVSFVSDYNCTYFDTFFSPSIQTDGTEIVSYLWEFGDDSTSTISDPIYRYTNSGTYFVKLTAIDSRGATGVFSKEVRIFPSDAFSIDFDFDDVLCSNNAEQFINKSNGLEEGISYYRWDFGDPISSEPNSSNLTSPTHVFQQPGFYIITLITTGESGCYSSISKEIELKYAPEADFNASSTCLGQITNFTLTDEPASVISYSWDFADNFTSTDKNPNHSFAFSGFYNVQLTVGYDNGCNYVRPKPIFVPPLPDMAFNYEIACEGSNVGFIDFSFSDISGIQERRWFFDDGSSTVITTDPLINHTFQQKGSYDIKLEVLTEDGCTNSITKTIQVLETANVNFDWDSQCQGEPITFKDLTQAGNAGAIINRTWRIDGIAASTPQVLHTFNNSGLFPIILEITTQNGCIKTLSKTIEVYSKPSPNFEVTQSCIGQEIILQDATVSSDEIVEYNWQLIGTNQSVQDNQVAGFDIAESGIYNVELTVTSVSQCVSSVIKSIEVNGLPIANFKANPEFGAPPISITFNNNSIEATNFQWDFDNGENSSSVSPIYEFTEIGVYDVRLIAYNEAGCSHIAEKTIRIVEPALDLAINSLQSSDVDGNIQIVINITNRGTVAMNTADFEISLDNGLTVTESYSGTLNPNQTINYPLKFEIKKSQSNINLICVKGSWVIGSLTDKNFENNEACLLLNDQMQLLPPFPNPAQSEVNIPIVLPAKDILELNIQDSQGHQVYQENIGNTSLGLNTISIKTDRFSNGIYLIRIKYRGEYSSSKFVILR